MCQSQARKTTRGNSREKFRAQRRRESTPSPTTTPEARMSPPEHAQRRKYRQYRHMLCRSIPRPCRRLSCWGCCPQEKPQLLGLSCFGVRFGTITLDSVGWQCSSCYRVPENPLTRYHSQGPQIFPSEKTSEEEAMKLVRNKFQQTIIHPWTVCSHPSSPYTR